MSRAPLPTLLFLALLIAPAGAACADETAPRGAGRRLVLSAVTGFPDLLGFDLALRPFPARIDLEAGAGAGPFVARAHLHAGPSFLLADTLQADGTGWEVELPLRAGLGYCAAAADGGTERGSCAELAAGVQATRWFSAGFGLHLKLLGGAGTVLGEPLLGVTAYPVVAGTLGLAI